MTDTPTPAKRLEDLPSQEIPPSLRPLKATMVDAIEAAIEKAPAAVTLHQSRFAHDYTRCCLDKGCAIRPVLAVITLVKAEQQDVRRCVEEVLQALPVQERVRAQRVLEALRAPQTVPAVVQESEEEKQRAAVQEPESNPKVFISKMQLSLRQAKEQMGRYEEALAYARRALGLYPDHPDVLLWGATCYRAAANDRYQKREDRVTELREAAHFLEKAIVVMNRPPYAGVPAYDRRRKTAREALEKIRASLASGEKK